MALPKVPEIPDEWLCCICKNIARNPVTLNNDKHVFCEECIKNWLITCEQKGKRPTNPMTNEVITFDYTLQSQTKLKQDIDALYNKYKYGMEKDKTCKAFYDEHLAHFDKDNKILIKLSPSSNVHNNTDDETRNDDNDKNTVSNQNDADDGDAKKDDHTRNAKNNPSESEAYSGNVWTIPYSDTFTHSPGFDEIEDRFNQEYEMRISLNTASQRIATPKTLFFEHLHATLVKIGCAGPDIKSWFIEARKHILMKMVASIYSAAKNDAYYQLISKLETVTADEEIDQKAPEDVNHFINHVKDGKFECKLKLDFKTWQEDKIRYERIFKSEVADSLRINPSMIEIKDAKQGSVIVDFWILNIWIPVHVSNFSHDPIPRHYNMRPNDQIEVKVKHKPEWYEATIVDVRLSAGSNGKRFKARYNPIRGKDIFATSNTEWFCSLKEGWRLRLPNQVFIFMNSRGVKINTVWQPRPLAPIQSIFEVRVGHHIYVTYKETWYRCEVIEARDTFKGKKLEILYLVHRFMKNTEWLELWKPEDIFRISLRDKRPVN